MTHFEAYRWEDHVPRAGGWKFNLAAGVLALAVIAAAFPDTDGNASAAATAAVPRTAHPARELQVSDAPALTVLPVNSWRAPCPPTAADYADS